MTLRVAIHLALHGIVPLTLALTVWRKNRWAFVWLMAAMIVDLDHLLATPVFAPDRCSIGFHPLHTAPAMVVYILMTVWPKTRLLGVGLVVHMLLDGIDCVWMLA